MNAAAASGFFGNGELAWQLKKHRLVAEQTGQLGVLELGDDFDFPVRRTFFLRGIQPDATRGAHSHRELRQLLICLSGSLRLDVDSGSETGTIRMRAGDEFVYLDGRAWREMSDFSADAVLLVLCDREYEHDEVVRDYDLFQEIAGASS